jgi:predicted nucleotidyltransferase
MTIEGLSDHAHAVSFAALGEEGAKREHVVVAVSGAHAYGFPSPDSDVDLKAVHVAPTRALLGLHVPASAASRVEIIDGVEIDYTSNELGAVVSGLLAGNGNYLERVAGHCTLVTSELHAPLRELALAGISRRYAKHYAGFARQLYHALEANPSVKKALYVLRTALTGTHLLKTGELRIDLRTVAGEYGFGVALDLVEQKRSGEKVAMSPEALAAIRPTLDRALALLDEIESKSPLPLESKNAREAEAWLVELRLARSSRA